MSITFSSSGITYTATERDIFMNNGARIVFIRGGKHAGPYAESIALSDSEWRRIKQQLTMLDYEQYFGRKPLVSNVDIYQVKQQ